MKHSNRIRQWCRFQRPIVPLAMPLMDLRVIQHRRRWVLPWQNFTQQFRIAFEQSVDGCGHLASHTTDYALFSDIGLRLFVEGASRFHQALIQKEKTQSYVGKKRV